MTEKEQTAGMLIHPAGAALPVEIEVESSGRRPVSVAAHSPVPNGRYKLVSGNWLATVVAINGELEVADALAEIMMSPEQRKQFKHDQAACVVAFGKPKGRR